MLEEFLRSVGAIMPPQFELVRTLTLGFCLGLLGSCFEGDFAHGHPCDGDSDCGPALECIEGLCGGPGAGLCGNGLIDLGELCDDGNTLDGDGCSVNCDFCGNGVVDSGEECDDGNTLDGDFCTPVCRSPVCGDGFAAPDEECDDGNAAGDDGCTPACTLPACGDGFINATGEDCDDGNSVETDVCTNACTLAPEKPVLELSEAPVKQFEFSWSARGGVTYDLFERVDADASWEPIAEGLTDQSFAHTVPLHLRPSASYYLRACNEGAAHCPESEVVEVEGDLGDAVGEFLGTHGDFRDVFGANVALAGEGDLLVVGVPHEDSLPLGLAGSDPSDNSQDDAGAAYVFTRDEAGWSQHAFLKASGPGPISHDGAEGDDGPGFGSSVVVSADGSTIAAGSPWELVDGSRGAVYLFVREGEDWTEQARLRASNTGGHFGWALALSADGSTLAVGAGGEASAATGVDGDQDDTSAPEAGAVYVFTRAGQAWSQQAYIKASNSEPGDRFGGKWRQAGAQSPHDGPFIKEEGNVWFGGGVALSADGDTLVATAFWEDGGAAQDNNTVPDSGAAYVFEREAQSWSQTAYIKASTPTPSAHFGTGVALASDGGTLVVGAAREGDEGATYVFVREGGSWTQETRLEAPNAEFGDLFGAFVAISADGQFVAVAAPGEDSISTGINGDPDADLVPNYQVGAVYLFERQAASWSHTAYVKPPTTRQFCGAVALSAKGHDLAFGCPPFTYLY